MGAAQRAVRSQSDRRDVQLLGHDRYPDPQDGRNAFIAECKFWKGEKAFLEAIEQLLSYLSWRDTNVPVLIFNRNVNFTDVLATIASAEPRHSCFKHEISRSDESTFRYLFRQLGDPNREATLTVMAFDVPAPR